jgi:hypothetical protein
MLQIDWTTYVNEQMLWAERLMAVAEEADAEERHELYLRGQEALLEASRKLGELLRTQAPE